MKQTHLGVTLYGFLLILAAGFVCLGVLLQWHNARLDDANDAKKADYAQATAVYETNNIFYNPAAVTNWLVSRQNPKGYFVPNPDLLFEPSQLNSNSLRATRYAVLTLQRLNALHLIDRRSIIDFVMSLYLPIVTEPVSLQDTETSSNGSYAGFNTVLEGPPGVRPTMDALLTLDALNALGDARLNLHHLRNYILAHQNTDGGFWDDHYPEYGQASCTKCTSFALRSLRTIHRHLNEDFNLAFKEKVAGYIESSLDESSGGYSDQPGLPAEDSYDTFRAFITLWSLADGSKKHRMKFVSTHMDVDRTIRVLIDKHFLPADGAFSRFSTAAKKTPSLKATHLSIWIMTRMQRLSQIDVSAIARYVLQSEGKAGEYGGDIYSTYSATGVLKKLAISETPLTKPMSPDIQASPYPGFLAYLFYGLGFMTLAFGYLSKKNELLAINRALQKQASIDALTNIYNRQKSDELLNIEIKQAERYQTIFSIILFDIDNFKDINDRHGHLAGDKVLQVLAKIVAENIREVDYFARWGGEEFLIISAETPENGAIAEAEKLRKKIAQTDFSQVERITCSFGIAEYQAGDTTVSVTSRADRALYAAKESGRNRVCSDTSGRQLKNPAARPAHTMA